MIFKMLELWAIKRCNKFEFFNKDKSKGKKFGKYDSYI